MLQIDWTNKLDVGLPEINAQHRELIDLSNGLIQAMTIGKGADVLDEAFTQLREYTKKHFRDEEAYMREIGYPELDKQEKVHKLLVMEVDNFHEELAKGNVTPKQALDFINGWIVKHIVQMDSKIGEYARTL